jgi:nickel-dependent lactate racemase
MDVHLPYGHSVYGLHLPDSIGCTTLQAESVAGLDSLEERLNEQLDSALQTLGSHQSSCRSAAIAVPDVTRPTPLGTILPILVKRLEVFFPILRPEAITVVIGGGLHPPPDKDEQAALLPMDCLEGMNIIAHDALHSPVTEYGLTSRGTPVAVNAAFAQADLKIVVGQIDPHQFVGFTGGAKGVIIGTGAEKTIEHNHSQLFQDQARVGALSGNPVREDLNEAGRMVGIDLAVNVVLNPNKEVVAVFCGNPDQVLIEGAECCARVYGVPLTERFDIIIASCGGHPKDITLYQAQKGLNLASQALKPNGRICLLAACEQGIGDPRYADYVSCFQSIDEAMADFNQRPFQMGAHKCYLFGCTLTCHEAVLHSELEQSTLQQCLLTGGNAQDTLDAWLNAFPGSPRIGVVPYANTTYFIPEF